MNTMELDCICQALEYLTLGENKNRNMRGNADKMGDAVLFFGHAGGSR